ncbi:MAG: restriction endonuclease subunit S [Pseudomonadota bacterium]
MTEITPRQWPTRRLKFAATINNEALSEDTDPDFDLQYVDIGNVDSAGVIHEIASYRFENAPSRARRKVQQGDVIISTVRTYLQAIAPIENPPDNLIVSTGFAVVRPRGDTLGTRFCKFALREPSFLSEVVRSSVGVSYPAINASELGNILVYVPPLIQQNAVADFLDRETAKIDTLIVAKERLLGILAEKRRALITHAVTRGLNPDAPLCDSGFSWLGQIPADWNVIKLKHIAAISYGFGDELDKSLTSGVPLISLPNVSIDGALDLTDLGWADLTESEKSTLLLKRGDLLFNWRNGSSQHLAKTAYFDADGEYTHVGFLLRIRFDLNKFEALFYQAFLNALRVTGFFLYSRAMVNNTFNQTELANLPVVVPPIAEQRTIVSYIKKETAKMDALREAAEKTIGLLKERRAALIAAAVTGQIDV